jgi:hypothetical protein
MRPSIIILFSCFAVLGLAGCSSSDPVPQQAVETHIVSAGEKAIAGHLTYSIVDSQILARLEDDASPRIPQDRFVVVQIAVTNTGNVDNPIPAVELVSDSGKIYNELADGTGVTTWLGVVRHVGAGQTQRGNVAFDAPAAHYKVKFSDETLDHEILADLPLSYMHEKINDVLVPNADLPDETAPAGAQKKK